MNRQTITVGVLAFVLPWMGMSGPLAGQERERAQEREQIEQRANAARHRIGQLEEQIHKLMQQRKKIGESLESLDPERRPDRHEKLMEQRAELDTTIRSRQEQFAEAQQWLDQVHQHLRELDSDRPRERDRERPRDDDRAGDQGRNQDRNRHRDQDRQRQRDLDRQRQRDPDQQRERDQDRPRQQDRDESEIRDAKNRLEHMRQAMGHLREAGLTEIAGTVGQRIEKLQAAMRASERRQRESASGHRLPERPRQRTSEHEAFRKEIGGAIRELNAAIRELRRDVDALRRDYDRR